MFLHLIWLTLKPLKMQDNVEDLELVITEEDLQQYKRLDHLLTARYPEYSRSFLKNLHESDLIYREDERKLELKKVPPIGTRIIIELPPPIPLEANAENIPLAILYEDEDLVVVNKPAGMVTHPAPGNYSGTLVNAILYHCPDLKGIGNVKRPGIVHRLDKGTSGVMVVAKSQKAHENLVAMFSKHDLERIYECITYQIPSPLSGKIESTIGRSPTNRLKMAANVKNGKKALTYYKVLHSNATFAHVECKLETGRTHQIRVHLSQLLKTPILNDETYAQVNKQKEKLSNELNQLLETYEYPFLHAKVLNFNHPLSGKRLEFSQEAPEMFNRFKVGLGL